MSRAIRQPDGVAEPDTSLSPATSHWQDRLDELLRLRDLDEDWDGQGAARPSSELVDAAIAWLQRMRTQPTASPPTAIAASPGGEVVFVWQGVSTFVEAEIVSSDHVEWMRSVRGQPVEHWESSLEGAVETE